jgi:hypothetical protein
LEQLKQKLLAEKQQRDAKDKNVAAKRERLRKKALEHARIANARKRRQLYDRSRSWCQWKAAASNQRSVGT